MMMMMRMMMMTMMMIKGEDDDDVEDDDVEEEEDDDVEEEDRSQDRDPHFVRARAVEMHLDISQEPLYAEIYRQNAVAHPSPE